MGQPQLQSSTGKAVMVTVKKRRALVIKLRERGLRYDEIAAMVTAQFGAERLPEKWGADAAVQDVLRGLEALNKETAASLEEVRALELGRLDRMLAGVWDRATAGDLKAIDTVLKIMRRRDRYLGLSEAIKVQHSWRDSIPAEHQALADDLFAADVAEMAARMRLVQEGGRRGSEGPVIVAGELAAGDAPEGESAPADTGSDRGQTGAGSG